MLDIDYFKRYNDHYGHLEGDHCLKLVANALEEFCRRPFDFVARYGGEEFSCILPNTSLAGAGQVAEGMREAVAGLKVPHAKSDVSDWVSISLGVAHCQPPGTISPDELLKKADDALYRAKQKGRNQVSL